MTIPEKATVLNQRAARLEKRGRRRDAVSLYKKAIALAPDWPIPLYNLGLLFKRQRRWKPSLRYNRLATLMDPDNEAAWWNLGIAATALGRWRLARRAWRGFGIAMPRGEGPIDFPCGVCPIRLHPDGNAEVVWAHRLDPARAVLVSIPFPESGYRWGDMVLNDGAPNGYRTYKGEQVAVLDALELLEPSPFGTYIARVQLPAEDKHAEDLAHLAAELEGSAEDWTTSVRILCRACSEGRAHETHDTEAAPPDGVHLIGIAARDREHATKILHIWESGRSGVLVESLEDALEPGSND
ncbi:MAG TPA: tetratricopeptide repeat protein [Gemmataceae bacterium]|nr:tetratricopeptide repeat protein [Gemmataceae bacterium]